MALYKGYSTIGFKSGNVHKGQYPSTNIDGTTIPFAKIPNITNTGNNTFVLNDIALVERNLRNHIFTPKGSRVMMPKFGTIIPDILFEPLNEYNINRIRQELTKVVDYDPRVKLINLTISPVRDENRVNCSMVLQYIELNVTRSMNFNLEFV
jgi:phage baseplate assembly protein W